MEYAYLTDIGRMREQNEDRVIVAKNASGEFLLAVADGMGGHRHGEIASEIAISTIEKRFLNQESIGNKEAGISFIKETVSEANTLLYEYTKEHPDSLGMGTTIVLAIMTADYLLFGNIGDSSGYVCRNKKIHKITSDHTLVNLLVKSGELTEEEAREHPRKNVLMRALGAQTTVEMDIFDVETDIDGVFLCSDGLSNMLTDEQIAKVLNENITIEEKIKKLITKSNNRGGSDNISAAYLVKVGAK